MQNEIISMTQKIIPNYDILQIKQVLQNQSHKDEH